MFDVIVNKNVYYYIFQKIEKKGGEYKKYVPIGTIIHKFSGQFNKVTFKE